MRMSRNRKKEESVSHHTNAVSDRKLRFTHAVQQTSAEEGGSCSAIRQIDISIFTAFVFSTGCSQRGLSRIAVQSK